MEPGAIDISMPNHDIIVMAHRFAELERAARAEMDAIRDQAVMQIENVKLLMVAMEELCGSSIVPCVLRALPGIAHKLSGKTDNFTKKGLVSVTGEQLIRTILI